MTKTTASSAARGNLTSLAAYRRKRNFSATPDPRGRRRGTSRAFFVQKHAARRLHYDFRLELHGALKSWAVPNRPTTKPGGKRLAIHVEDHPIEYGAFEGQIPKGQYGAGKVELWDRGEWEPIGDADSGYRRGRLTFRLRGRRLTGIWSLVRMAGAASDRGRNWLLIKNKDRHPAGTGRSADRSEEALAQAPRGRVPARFPPQLALAAKAVPRGDDWLFEVKRDGYRILATTRGGRTYLTSRNGKNWTARFPTIAQAVQALPLKSGMLDGELVALRRDGTSDFQLLQDLRRSRGKAKLAYFVFDLPFYEGRDLRGLPLIERKRVLAGIVRGRRGSPVRYNDHVRGDGESFLKEACGLGLEGVVAKRVDARYESKRSPSWRKIKCAAHQELVIAGWTDPRASRKGFGALVLAHHDAKGRLVYSGKVGSGFSEHVIAELGRRMKSIAAKRQPFAIPPPASELAHVHWVRPKLVAEIRFTEWTGDGKLRHPSFIGIRDDKDAREVVREVGP